MDEAKRIETRARISTTGTERTLDRYGRVIREREALLLRQATLMKTDSGELVTFISPSVCALALHEAIDASERAELARLSLAETERETIFGTATEIGGEASGY